MSVGCKSAMAVLPVAVLLILAAAVSDVSGIWCYQCNSYFDKDCEQIRQNDTHSPYYKECPANELNAGAEIFCRKTVQLILDPDFEHTRTIRSCGWVRHPKYQCYSVTNKGHEEESCSCYKDGCNSATKSLGGASLAALVSLLAAFRSWL